LPTVEEDDEVVLLGSQGEACITGDEIAALARTISYEVYCSLGRHRDKVFSNSMIP
jgi:alanine racemase